MTKKTDISADTLRQLGIILKPENEAQLLDMLQATLDERVGAAVAELLDDNSLLKLDELVSQGDSQAVEQFVASKVPDYEQVMKDEYDILIGEVAAEADGLNAAGQR